MAGLTRSAILRISDEKTLELVELYMKEECLWNTGIDDYKDKIKRHAAAQRIAQTLALAHFDAHHVTTKFKNLRNSYCQELKKIATSLNSGAVGSEVYKPKVFWFAKMDSFLRPHLQHSRTSPFVVIDEVSKDSKDSVEYLVPKSEPVESQDFEADGWTDKSQREEVIMMPGPASESSSDEDDPLVGKKTTRTSGKQAKRQKTESHSCCEENSSAQMLKSISSQLEVLSSSREDTFDTFGKYIASLLRSMPAQKALNLQPRIVSLVANAALKNSEDRVSQSGQNS